MDKDPQYYIQGVRDGNRLLLSRTITLIESSLPTHQYLAAAIIEGLLDAGRDSVRIGITGVPGAGKSTFIDGFGTLLTKRGHQVAVLAIDPSSSRSGGSVLGDKTRMINLCNNPRAFIRPSPTGGTLGGVARKTREAMLVCEAAGFDVIIIETVGVGQSETAVASMVDFFLVLMIAGAGDELQGIKKGILEMADTLVINKADGDNLNRAEQARRLYESALHLLAPDNPRWSPPVLTCSALEGSGLEEIWQTICRHRELLTDSGDLARRRNRQSIDWLHQLLAEGLRSWFYGLPEIRDELPALLRAIEERSISPAAAAASLLQRLAR